MKSKPKLLTRLLSFMLVLIFAVGQPLSALGDVLDNGASTAFSQELVDYLTALYGEEGARLVLESLYEMGLIDRYGNFLTYSVVLDGKELSRAELEALLADPNTDLTRECTVDGQTITLQDIKIMLEIEKELERIRTTYYDTGVDMTDEHKATLQSLINQLQASGINLQLEDSAAKDDAAIEKGYKSQLARITVSTADVSVNQGQSVTVTFNLTKALPYAVSFDYRTVDGAAKAGTHYTAASDTVIFEAGATEKSITIQTSTRSSSSTNYTTDRWGGDRAFFIQYSNPKNILFDGDKIAASTVVRVQGNYDYAGSVAKLLTHSFLTQTTSYNIEGMPSTDSAIINIDGDDWGGTAWITGGYGASWTSPGTTTNSSLYLEPTEYMKGLVREDLVSGIRWMIMHSDDLYTVNSEGERTHSGKVLIAVPGTKHFEIPTNTIVVSIEGEFEGYQWGPSWVDAWGVVEYDLNNSDNKTKFLSNGFSMSFGFSRNNATLMSKPMSRAQLYFVDKTAPQGSNIQGPSGTFNPGEKVPFVVTYSEPVSPAEARLTLNNGQTLSPVESGGTYSRQLTFVYEVKDTDAATITAQQATGAKDMAGKVMPAYSKNVSAALNGMEKTQAFQSITLDKTSYYPGQSTGVLTVALDKSKSNWVEQGNAVNSIKASVDGGQNFLNMELINEGAALQAEIPLKQYVDGEDHELRVELYLNKDNTGKPEDFTCVIGKYVDYVIHPVVFVEKDDISIQYPVSWPSGKENLVYLTASTSTILTYTYNGDATYKDFAWSSSDVSVAQIDAQTGKIQPVSAGKVTFKLTALNGEADPAQNVFVESVEITVNPGGEPSLVIPEDMNTVIVTKGNPADIRWSTNVTYKNMTDFSPARDTTFTVKLYEGELTADQTAAASPFKTYTVTSAADAEQSVSSFSIPAQDIQEISKGNRPSYTVRVEVKHPENDTILSAHAYILVRSQAAVVRLDPLSNSYLLDTAGPVALHWNMTYFDTLNEGEFEFKVSRNDTVIADSVVTFENKAFTSETVTDNGGGAYSGTCVVPLAEVSNGTLSDVYTVNIKAKNRTDSTWSYDSFVFYVYNADALQILVDGEEYDKVVLSNIQGISGMNSEEILSLGRNITLRKAISINFGAYAWQQVTDKIAWAVENSSIASVNFAQGGRYDNIENYSYTTYRPSEEFILSGRGNGKTIITVTHDATGMTDTLEVEVQTLKDKLYIFQASPKAITDVTYTTKNEKGEAVEKTVKTNADGALAVYEPNGITGSVQMKSTYAGKVYMGTITHSSLQSGEVDVTDVGLYPVNNIKLRQPAEVVFYLKKPDGTPYTGKVTYRGGVYKNSQYCNASTTDMDGTTVQVGPDGKLTISMDVTTFWVEGKEQPETELYAADKLDFMFEVQFADDAYYPLLLKQSGNLGTDDLVKSADMVVSLDEADGKEPFIARQVYRDNYIGAKEIDVRKYSKKIGPSTDYPDNVLETTVLWWGMEDEDLSAASLKLTDEYGVVPTGQTYQTFKYPFSTITVSQNTQVLNESTIWMEPKYSRGITMRLNKDENTLYKTFSAPFRVINMLGTKSVIADDSGTVSIIATIKDAMTVDGGSMSLGDAFIGAGLGVLEATSFSSPIFTMQIAATQDPTVYNVLIKAGYGNMDGGDTTGLYMTAEREESSADPSVTDKLAMLKDEYLADDPLDTKIKNRAKYGAGELYYELSGYYEGQVVYDYEEDCWKSIVHTGGFTAGGGFGYQWNFNSWVGPVPVTAELGLGAAVAVDFAVKAQYEEQTYNGEVLEWAADMDDEYVNDYLTTLRIYAYLNAFGGIGFDYSVIAFKFGVFGQIALDSRNTWLNREYLADESERKLNGQQLTLEGRVGIRFYARFLFISYEKILTSYTYTKTWVYNNWKKIYDYWEQTTGGPVTANTLSLAIDTYIAAHPGISEISDVPRLENRDYLSKFDRVWNNGSGIRLFSLDTANGAPTNLQTNAYPYADPQLAEDGSLFVYLSDAGSENVEDTVASYAVRSGSSYADRGAIAPDDKGYGDSSLNFAGNSQFGAAVWVRQTSGLNKDAGDELTNAEQALMANSTEIMVSRMVNGQWTATERLTNNGTPDMAPVVAVNGERIFVAWRSVYIADESNVTDFTGSDAILYTVFDGTDWSEPDTLYNGTSGSVMGLEAAMLKDGTAAITYTLDKGSADEATGLRTDSSVQHTTEDYEIVYAVISDDGQVRKNQQITSDSELDENPQITTAKIGDEEYYILAWYNVSTTGSQKDGDQKTVSDIRLAAIDSMGNIRTAETGFVDSLTNAAGGQNVGVDSNFRFVRSADRDVNSLSLIWASTAGDQKNADENVADSGILRAVRFVQDGTRVYASAVIDVAEMPDNAQIDHFDAYASNNTVKAIILGTASTGETIVTSETTKEPTGELDEKGNIVYQEVPLKILETVSGLYTATETYQNTLSVPAVDADLKNMVKGLSMPVKFTVQNDGIHTIDQIQITLDGTTTTFGSDVIQLQPGQQVQVTVDYEVPADAVVNPSYSVIAHYTDDSYAYAEDTLTLAIPDVGVSDVTVTKEADGEREFTVTLYNGSEVELAYSGRNVKLGLYADGDYQETLMDVITLSSDADLQAVDEGSYVHKFTFDIQDYIAESGYGEIPDSGIPVYIRAWIVSGDQEVAEYNTVNNTNLQQFYSLQKDNEGDTFKVSVDLTNADTTTAEITMQNLTMQTVSNGNAAVNLLNSRGDVIETKYLATDAEGLLKFGPEGILTAAVTFSQLGDSVEVVQFTSSVDAMEGHLADLKANGIGFTFDSKRVEYTLQAENKTTTNITAVAMSSDAGITVRDGNGILRGQGTGTVAVTVPLTYTSIDGEAVDGASNRFTVEVQPTGEGAQPVTYTLLIQNNQRISGTVVISPPMANHNDWVNAQTTDQPLQVTISAQDLQEFELKTLQYSLDGGKNWKETQAASVSVPLPGDGVYDIRAKAVDVSGAKIEANPAIVRVDRTAPTLDWELTLEETTLPLENENIFQRMLRAFKIATNRQVKLTAKALDDISGLKSVVATTASGDTYELTANGDGTYSTMITRAYEGVITVIATDNAGNRSAPAYSGNVIIDDQLPAPEMQLDYSDVTEDSIRLSGSVEFEKDDYFGEVKLMVKEADSLNWRVAETYRNAEDAKNIDVVMDKLDAATQYDFQLAAGNVVGDSTVTKGIQATTRFATPKSPEMESRTSREITLKAVEGAQYRRLIEGDEWTAWQTSPQFTGLTPNMAYTFEMRIAASGGIPESFASTATITTLPFYAILFDKNTDDAVGDLPNMQNVGYMEQAQEPESEPSRPGYTFTGWYTDKGCEEADRFDFSIGVTTPVHLYAGWSENIVTADDYIISGEKAGDWYTSDVVIRPSGDYEVIWNGEEWDTSYTIQEGKEQNVSFKLGKIVDGKMVETTFLHEPLVLSVDTSDPTGQITVGENTWAKFLNTITFGLFFKETVDVDIKASDRLSGVQSIEYVKAGTPLTEAELAEADWIVGDSFSVEPDDTFVVYARITDNTERAILISSDGVITDASKPDLHMTYAGEGEWTAESGASIEVEVSDSLSGVDSITYTVDGKEYTTRQTSFRIADLPDGDYDVVVTVTDKAGNTATETIHVKKDTVVPGLSVTADLDQWTNEDVELSIACGEVLSGQTLYVSQDGSEEVMLEQGIEHYTVSENGTYVFRLVSGSGLESSYTVTVDKIDKELPTLEISYDKAGEWDTDGETGVVIKAADSQSGIRSVEYVVNGQSYTSDVAEFVMEDLPDGEYEILVTAVDAAGNRSDEHKIAVKREGAVPGITVDADPSGQTEGPVTLTVHLLDQYVSGVALYVSKDGGKEERLPENTFTYLATENGTYTFRLVTGAGQETAVSYTVNQIQPDDGLPSIATGNNGVAPIALVLFVGSGGMMVVCAAAKRRKKRF
mgnify:CR=1 FL=1